MLRAWALIAGVSLLQGCTGIATLGVEVTEVSGAHYLRDARVAVFRASPARHQLPPGFNAFTTESTVTDDAITVRASARFAPIHFGPPFTSLYVEVPNVQPDRRYKIMDGYSGRQLLELATFATPTP